MKENNKIIAEFMGCSINKNNIANPKGTKYTFPLSNNEPININDLRYHLEWNWLMPVIEQIRNVTSYDRDRFGTEVNLNKYKVEIKSGSYSGKKHSKQYFIKNFDAVLNSRQIKEMFKTEKYLDSFKITYLAVIDYINWYNKK